MDKPSLRKSVWQAMKEARVVRFPGTDGRIPNFVGAERAAARLGELPEWEAARVVKVNPDSPQRPVRTLALEQGKTVLMAVPRLVRRACFLLLDPDALPASPQAASTIKGASRYGQPVPPEDVPPVDLMVLGSVAVSRSGDRFGKGGGYADLEYALLRRFGKTGPATPVFTTVHPVQVVEERIPMTAHDVPLHGFVTPEGVHRCRGRREFPGGIYWDHLDPGKIASIPILQELASENE